MRGWRTAAVACDARERRPAVRGRACRLPQPHPPSPLPRLGSPERIRVPDPARRRPAQPGSRRPAGEPPLGKLRREHRRERASAPRLRDQPDLRDPVYGRRRRPSPRSRSSSPNTAPNRTPGPIRCRRTRRSREAAKATATVTCWWPRKAAARCTSSTDAHSKRRRPELDRGLGRDLQPAQRSPATGRLDLRRRGRPADLPAARALPGGRARRDRPRPAGHGAARPSAATSTPPPTSPPRAATRRCRRWGCACG